MEAEADRMRCMALCSRQIDLGLAHPPFGTNDWLRVIAFAPEKSIAVIPEDGQVGGVTLAQVAARGLILFPANLADLFRSIRR